MATTHETHEQDAGKSRKGPSRTQAERRAASERRLLDATAELIAERGTSSVSFADIARAAGCSHGLPGYIFGSKTKLLLALVDDALRLFRKTALAPALTDPGDNDGLEIVLKLMETFLQSLTNPWPRTRALYVLMGEGQGAPPELQEALTNHHTAARELLERSLEAGVTKGEIRPDIRPDAQAVAILGVLRGIGFQVLLDPETIDIAAVTDEVMSSTRRALAVNPEG